MSPRPMSIFGRCCSRSPTGCSGASARPRTSSRRRSSATSGPSPTDTAVESPKAYLSAVVTRLAIDHLKSARVRRETYVGEWLPEPLVTDEGAGDPAEHRRAGRLAVDVVPRPARAADPGRAGGLPAPRRVRLRLRGGRPDRRRDAGDVPAARGPGAAVHRREPAAVRRVGAGARRARSAGSSPRPSRGDVDGLIEVLAEDVDRLRRRRRQGPPVVRADRRRRQRRPAVRPVMGRQMPAMGATVRAPPRSTASRASSSAARTAGSSRSCRSRSSAAGSRRSGPSSTRTSWATSARSRACATSWTAPGDRSRRGTGPDGSDAG